MKSLELVQSCLLACCLLAACCSSAPSRGQPVDDATDGSSDDSDGRVIYDQRQSGKYNIRISIKDVAIIEMDQNGFGDGSFGEEDYYYDDADLTVKPIKFTTPKPAGTTAGNHSDSGSTAAAYSTASASASTAITTPITTTTTTEATTQPDRVSYSSNLLADIAASQALSTTKAAAAATTTPLATTPARKTPSVVIIESTAAYSAPQQSTQRALLYPNALAARSKHIPVHLALSVESKAHPAAIEKTATTTTSLQQALHRAEGVQLPAIDDDSKIFNFKMQRANKSPPQAMGAHTRHCRHHQYRDLAGNCRTKRSSSFLRKLFGMIASFPFARVERAHDNE